MSEDFSEYEKHTETMVDTLEAKRVQEFVRGFQTLRNDVFKDWTCFGRLKAHTCQETGGLLLTIQVFFQPKDGTLEDIRHNMTHLAEEAAKQLLSMGKDAGL